MENNIENNMSAQPKRNLPRDLFLHLLAMVALYWSAISFVTLLWQFVNYFFPDPLRRYYNEILFSGPIRFAISSLIIVFPIFIFTSWYLNKIYKRELSVRESRIRKWLIYLTLFIASLIIIGDLVGLINIFLGGDLTIRFALKALAVLLVAGIIFAYYLDDVRKDTSTKLSKYFAWLTSIIVLICVVGAFFIVGSPTTARLIQFDQQKINDLQEIQYEIVHYYRSKESLPNSLFELEDSISGFKIPKDPQTEQSYEYFVLDFENLSFELCANFNKDGKDKYGEIYPIDFSTKGISENWEYTQGRFCFNRNIDPQIYPPFSERR
jgi:type III secretory pathway component EscS